MPLWMLTVNILICKFLLFLVIPTAISQGLSGEMTVTWVPPTRCTDNTPIAETGSCTLIGYRIYYATTLESVIDRTAPFINVTDRNINTYTFTDLDPVAYYIIITAYNKEFRETTLAGIMNEKAVIPRPPVIK